jgi:GNAT superfamily N-acetyltransferase
MNSVIQKLDNPVWFSLSETHQAFSIGGGNIRFYRPDCCPFGGVVHDEDIAGTIDAYSHKAVEFFIVGDRPRLPATVILKTELVCDQMVLYRGISIQSPVKVVNLREEHRDVLFRLVNSVQPGYFMQQTFLLGRYYGIFADGRLVAVSGERMKMNGYTEVSAVVTLPGYTGKGYASSLVAHTVNEITREGRVPYLHVASGNKRAISLYEKLGFQFRRKISFWNLKRSG